MSNQTNPLNPHNWVKNYADYLYAVGEFDTRGDDVAGLVLNLQGGGTFAGTIGFRRGPLAHEANQPLLA